MKKLLLLFFIASGFSAVSQTKPKPKPPVNGFGIQITARILDDCKKLSDLSFGEFHGTDSDVQNVTLNAKGEFAARYWLKEPGLFYFRKGGHTEYFMVSAKQELYKIDLSCTNDALNPLQIMSSPENKSYKAFSMLRKNLNTDLESYSKKSLDDVAAFEEFTNRIRNYQKALNLLMKQNPQSYAATYFAADRIGEKDLSSIQNLRLNYLKRQIFADQKFYNTPLPTYILENYFDYIADKNDNSFAVFEGLLNTASKNTEAAKRLQNVLYEAIFRSKRQELIAGYVNWAKAHPDKIVHAVVQAKLERLSKSINGVPFINMALKDTIGNTLELKDVVTSSKLTVLVFYSPTCSHCQETMPKLIPLPEQYHSKFKMYLVAPNSEKPEWLSFIKKYTKPGWINVMDDPNGSHFAMYAVSSLPTLILIDSQGKIVSRMDSHDDVRAGVQKWLDTH